MFFWQHRLPCYMPDGVTIEAPVSEPVAEAQAEAITAASDAAVEIAQIEADARVEIAQSDNATSVAITEIVHANDEDDLLWLRGQLDALQVSLVSQEAKLSSMEQQQASMTAMLTSLLILIPPPPVVEVIPEEAPLIVENPDLSASVADTPNEAPRPRRRWLA